jgi:cysteine synthase
MISKAQELAKENGWFLASQFETDANALIHRNTTAREILSDFAGAGKALDYWVTGYGTGGTVTGVAEVLRRESPHTKIVLSEPDVAALIASGVPQVRVVCCPCLLASFCFSSCSLPQLSEDNAKFYIDNSNYCDNSSCITITRLY